METEYIFYFTFGTLHDNSGCYVQVSAISLEAADQKMMQKYGANQYGCGYTAEEFLLRQSTLDAERLLEVIH